jgi:hypothetical protein
VQSYDGFRYRYFRQKYGSDAALRSFTISLDSPNNFGLLQASLGERFMRDYGYSIEWIPWESLNNFSYVSSGASGMVFKATWIPPPRSDGSLRYSSDIRKRTEVPIAVKSLVKQSPSALNELFAEVRSAMLIPRCVQLSLFSSTA